jgi:hypothetical protein
MIITVGQFIPGIKIVNKETGILGTENGADTFGHVMDTIVFGITDLKKEPGGILPGIILPEFADYQFVIFILISHLMKLQRAV